MTKAENFRPEEKNKEAARLFYEILKPLTDEYFFVLKQDHGVRLAGP